MAITFNGGTPQQRTLIRNAHARLESALAIASATPMSPAFVAFFGATAAPATVSSNYASMLALLQSLTFAYDLTSSLPMPAVRGVCLQIVSSANNTAGVRLWSSAWQSSPPSNGIWPEIYLDPDAGVALIAASLLHELGVMYTNLGDYVGVTDAQAARALARSAPDAAAGCAVNYVEALRALLVNPVSPSPPAGIAVASAGQTLGFYQAQDGSAIGTLPPLMASGPLTAEPLAYGRLAIFGEGDTSGPSQLHAFDTYAGVDLWMQGPPTVSGSVDSTPAATGNVAWICTGDGALVKVDLADPADPQAAVMLSFMAGSAATRVNGCLLSPDQQTLYASSSAGAYAITLGAAPTLAWSACKDVDLTAVRPVLCGATMVAASGTTLYGIAGGNTWTLALPSAIQFLASPPDGELAIANGSGDSFVVIDVASKSQVGTWSPGLAGLAFGQCLLAGNLLFLLTTAGTLAAYSCEFLDRPQTWSQLWSTPLDAAATRPVFAGGFLYVQDTAGKLYAFAGLTGALLWTKVGLPPATTAGLSLTPFVDESDAALYPSPSYSGIPSLTTALPQPFPAVASVLPGPAATYTLLKQAGQVLGEIFAPLAQTSFAASPDAASSYGLAEIGRMMQGQSLPFDAALARDWLAAVDANRYTVSFTPDRTHQVFGPSLAMLDFDGSSLPLARSVQGVVGLGGAGSPVPPSVNAALAMSGSTAQDAIQANPGDLDFTQRIHISTATMSTAQQILGQAVLTRATTTPAVPGITAQLVELKFGAFPFDFRRSGANTVEPKGTPIAWEPADIAAGSIAGTNVETGLAAGVTWADAQANPNWIKFDWIFSAPASGQVMNTSNVLDPTWQDPSGRIGALDGAQDAFLQEIYLDSAAAPLVATLYAALGSDLRTEYLAQLELEVKKFGTPGKSKYNVGKVAKRLYNLTRMNGRFLDAVFLQGVFQAPITVIYQVWSRIKGVGEAALLTSIPVAQILAQTQALIDAVNGAQGLNPTRRGQVVATLQPIAAALRQPPLPQNFESLVDTCQSTTLAWINTDFAAMIAANPGLQSYLDELVARKVSARAVAARFPRIYEGPEDWTPAAREAS